MNGTCLCAAVRYEIEGDFEEAHHCHCSRCRKAHGAAFATFACCNTGQLRVVAGDDRITVYRSRHVSRSFCGACGSSLFFAHALLPDRVWVAAGTLDDAGSLRPDAHTFVGSKAPWWSIDDGLAKNERQRPEYGG